MPVQLFLKIFKFHSYFVGNLQACCWNYEASKYLTVECCQISVLRLAIQSQKKMKLWHRIEYFYFDQYKNLEGYWNQPQMH